MASGLGDPEGVWDGFRAVLSLGQGAPPCTWAWGCPRSCLVWGKAGNSASTSLEGCFYLNEKKTQPALGPRAWQTEQGSPFAPLWPGALCGERLGHLHRAAPQGNVLGLVLPPGYSPSRARSSFPSETQVEGLSYMAWFLDGL